MSIHHFEGFIEYLPMMAIFLGLAFFLMLESINDSLGNTDSTADVKHTEWISLTGKVCKVKTALESGYTCFYFKIENSEQWYWTDADDATFLLLEVGAEITFEYDKDEEGDFVIEVSIKEPNECD